MIWHQDTVHVRIVSNWETIPSLVERLYRSYVVHTSTKWRAVLLIKSVRLQHTHLCGSSMKYNFFYTKYVDSAKGWQCLIECLGLVHNNYVALQGFASRHRDRIGFYPCDMMQTCALQCDQPVTRSTYCTCRVTQYSCKTGSHNTPARLGHTIPLRHVARQCDVHVL